MIELINIYHSVYIIKYQRLKLFDRCTEDLKILSNKIMCLKLLLLLYFFQFIKNLKSD